MEKTRKVYILLALCLVLTMLPANSAHAADEGSLWLRHAPSPNGVEVYICADTAVASGVITITYEAGNLEFVELMVSDSFVAAYAVNDKEAGVIRISWVGTGFVPEEGAYGMMTLSFRGVSDQSMVMSGAAYDASGDTIAITTLNLTELQAAMMQAEALDAAAYTEESFAGVTAALESANELLGKAVVTQAQLNEAARQLAAAMENLEAYVPEPPPTDPPAPTDPTEPAPTEPAPTQPQPTDPKPTQPGTEPAPTEPVEKPVPKKNDTMLIVAGVAIGVVLIAAVVVILKKRGKK